MRTLRESFEQLTGKRCWYRCLHRKRNLASEHKRAFHRGTLSEEIMRKYLQAAGYTLVQEEKWQEPDLE